MNKTNTPSKTNTSSKLPKEVLLKGVRLLKALVEGDDSARLPYSDWLLEYGMPGKLYVLNPNHEIVQDKVNWLRNTVGVKSIRGLIAVDSDVSSGLVHVYGTYNEEPFAFTSVWIGSFPIELWEEKLFC